MSELGGALRVLASSCSLVQTGTQDRGGGGGEAGPELPGATASTEGRVRVAQNLRKR